MVYVMRHSSWLGQKGGSAAQCCSGEKDTILAGLGSIILFALKAFVPGIFAWCAKQLFLAHWAEKWSLWCIKCMKHLVEKWERGGD